MLCASPLAALDQAAALVVATEWPDYRAISAEDVAATQVRWVLDANRFLGKTLGVDPRIHYIGVGAKSI